MTEISVNELRGINGGGLTLVEALIYSAAVVLSVSSPPALAITVVGIGIVEYQDYKGGV